MSDTPRTDAAVIITSSSVFCPEHPKSDPCGVLYQQYERVEADFARTLERELAAAQAELAACREDGTPLYLWKNGDHYLAFTHEHPCFGDGDPMTFGEPAARAIFKASHNGRRKEGA